MKIDLTETFELSKNSDAPIFNRIIKAQEELGELSAEILSYEKSKNKSKSATGTRESIVEESVDVLLCIADILSYYKAEDMEVQTLVTKKNAKWANKFVSCDRYFVAKPFNFMGIPFNNGLYARILYAPWDISGFSVFVYCYNEFLYDKICPTIDEALMEVSIAIGNTKEVTKEELNDLLGK